MKLLPVLVIALLVVVISSDAKPAPAKPKGKAAPNQVGSNGVDQAKTSKSNGKSKSAAKGNGKAKSGTKKDGSSKTAAATSNANKFSSNNPQAAGLIQNNAVPSAGLFSQPSPLSSLPPFPELNFQPLDGVSPGIVHGQTIGAMSLAPNSPGGNAFVLGGNPSPNTGGFGWVPFESSGQLQGFRADGSFLPLSIAADSG